jgi:hypothetical protein
MPASPRYIEEVAWLKDVFPHVLPWRFALFGSGAAVEPPLLSSRDLSDKHIVLIPVDTEAMNLAPRSIHIDSRRRPKAPLHRLR